MDKKQLAAKLESTLLTPATKRDIAALCEDAVRYGFAAVCVQPCYVRLCAKLLENSSVKVCTVVGFPCGDVTTRTKVQQTKEAVKYGAGEIDVVMNQSYAKGNEWKKVEKEIAAVVAAAGNVPVKVILETSALKKKDKIARACLAAVTSGAKFVKTSTGFTEKGATADVVKLMYDKVNWAGLGVKASGGIATYADAMAMLNAGASRIGTSHAAEIISEAE